MSLKIDISVCRVCCKSDATQSILKYAKKFHYCTSIEVAENDGLPDKICEVCLDRMKIAVEFKKKSEFSDRQLRSFICNVNNQFLALEGSSSASLDCDDEDDGPQDTVAVEETLPKGMIVAIPVNSALGCGPVEHPEQKSVREKSASPEPPEAKVATEPDRLPSPALESEPEPDPQPEQEQEKFRAVAVIQEKPAVKPEKELYEVVELEYDDSFVHEDEPMELEEPEQPEQHQHVSVTGSESGDSGEQVIYIGFTTDYQEQEEEDVNNSEPLDDDSERQEELSQESEPAQQESYRQESSSIDKTSPGTKFECFECSKSFSTKTNLNRHVQSHNGNKPFVCPLCNKGFTQGGSLKQHLLIHQNLRPFVCTVCDRAFTQQKSLTFHMRRHTNEKPFVCPHCSYAFRQKDGLKRHLMVKHTENDARMFDCDQCGKAFKTRYALSMHRKRHENGLPATTRER